MIALMNVWLQGFPTKTYEFVISSDWQQQVGSCQLNHYAMTP